MRQLLGAVAAERDCRADRESLDDQQAVWEGIVFDGLDLLPARLELTGGTVSGADVATVKLQRAEK